MAAPSKTDSAVQGLATVALIKANYDHGRDHIEMFLPFVLDCIATHPASDFRTSDVSTAMQSRHGLTVPHNTLTLLLSRAVRHGAARRDGGRYFRNDGFAPSTDIVKERIAIEQQQTALAEEFRAFANANGASLSSFDEALALVLRFFSHHHVAMLLDQPLPLVADEGSDDFRSTLTRREDVVAARFVKTVIERGDSNARVLQQMLEGYVLQNALLLKDISAASTKFRNLRVYLDTKIMLGTLGYRGEDVELATHESLRLLQDTGASLGCFAATIKELRGILAIYERHIGTHEGRQRLHQTDVTRYFLTRSYSPSDVREAAALVESEAKSLGIRIDPMPEHVKKHTLDEKSLAEYLASEEGDVTEHRVLHDVDCIAAILTMRKGKCPTSLDEAGFVF